METSNQSEDLVNEHIHRRDVEPVLSPNHSLNKDRMDTNILENSNVLEHLPGDKVLNSVPNTGPKETLKANEIRLQLRYSEDFALRQHKDHLDYSNTPSFSQFQLPYPLICRERYKANRKLYEHQFQKEIEQTINHQTKAFEAVCLVRVMAITSLWPPLHTRRNIEHTHQHYFQLTPRQKKRLDYIMRVN